MHILLNTFRNGLLREEFLRRGFHVAEMGPPPSGDDPPALPPGSFALVEMTAETMEGTRGLLDILAGNRVSVIALAAAPWPDLERFLLARGVPDLLAGAGAADVARTVEALASPPAPAGRIVILDDDGPRTGILASIIGRFPYAPHILAVQDDVFEQIDEAGASLLLVNLGTEGFDINGFLRQAVSRAEMKKVPVLPYKDAEEGLYVHEILSGLNRVARAILSPGELYAFLIETLFRKEISPALDRLNKTAEFTDHISFAKDTMARVYFSYGMDIFSVRSLVKEDALGNLWEGIASIEAAIAKVEPLKWLVKDDGAVPTCGPGA